MNKPTCAQGSYFYNGSCYFISNHRYTPQIPILSSGSEYLLTEILSGDSKDGKQLLPDSLQSSYLGTSLATSLFPKQANWLNASNFCQQLSNESTLIYFDNKLEYEFLINLLFKLKFPINETDYLKEETYFVGISYNRSLLSWQWLNGFNLNDSFLLNPNETTNKVNLPILRKSPIDYLYWPCGYINLRGNGDINIDNSNCDRDHKPYICKYGIYFLFNFYFILTFN